jgi:hypothetical protein
MAVLYKTEVLEGTNPPTPVALFNSRLNILQRYDITTPSDAIWVPG